MQWIKPTYFVISFKDDKYQLSQMNPQDGIVL